MVIAGPGSGKTTVITERTKYLIEKCGAEPSNILVITFSKAAAEEMKTRFFSLMGSRVNLPVTFGTFHAVYFNILKLAYGYTASNIIREDMKYQLIREFIRREKIDYEDEADFISSILGEISFVKNTGTDLAHYYSANCAESLFRAIYNAYDGYLKKNRYLDFDDMLLCCKELLEARPDILSAWQQKYRYILVDEFQDINQIQYDILKMLAEPEGNLFVVGDDDQSVYRFRGAKPEIMLNFTNDYPNSGQTILSVNYRSDASVVKAAGKLISNNKVRFQKQITAQHPLTEPVVCFSFQKQREQNLYVINEIRKLNAGGADLSDIAVLFRTNLQSGYFMQQLLEYNIPFYSKDGIPNVYTHWIALDLFAYIKIALGDMARQNLLRVMNRPKRYISRESLQNQEICFEEWKKFYEGQDWMHQRIRKLEMDLTVIAGMRPFSAVNYIRKGVGYEDYLREYATERRMNYEDLEDVLDELQESARNFETFFLWFQHIGQVEEELRQRTANAVRQSDAVFLSTYHSSKGLEFRYVFLVDANESITPYKKAVLDLDIEEERRLFYVAMTRCREKLYLLFSEQIHNKEMEESRFLGEADIKVVACPVRTGK